MKAEQVGGIQGVEGEGVGGMGQNVEIYQRANADILVKLNVVVYRFQKQVCVASNLVSWSY